MNICQSWDKEFISLSQKYKERERKFSFLARHIVIFGKHLSEFYWILLMSFEILNALLARKASTKILNWSTLFLLSLYTSRAGKKRQELWELSIISESAVQRCNIKNNCSEDFWKFSRIHRSCFNKITRPLTILIWDSTAVAFLRIFQNL